MPIINFTDMFVFRKNYCKTSEDFIEKLEQWQKDHNSDEEEVRYDVNSYCQSE